MTRLDDSNRPIRELLTDADVAACWPVMRQLRPRFDRDALVAAVKAQRPEGYRLVGAFDGERPVALAGFREMRMLYSGHSLYVDDLVTDEAERGTGVGKRLVEWLIAEARRLECAEFHLDSGVQRFGAHAFYFGRGMHIAGYHFALALTPPAS
jgi:GNAT superfamily N-acetyltransferase